MPILLHNPYGNDERGTFHNVYNDVLKKIEEQKELDVGTQGYNFNILNIKVYFKPPTNAITGINITYGFTPIRVVSHDKTIAEIYRDSNSFEFSYGYKSKTEFKELSIDLAKKKDIETFNAEYGNNPNRAPADALTCYKEIKKINSISGWYGRVGSSDMTKIRSLTFVTQPETKEGTIGLDQNDIDNERGNGQNPLNYFSYPFTLEDENKNPKVTNAFVGFILRYSNIAEAIIMIGFVDEWNKEVAEMVNGDSYPNLSPYGTTGEHWEYT